MIERAIIVDLGGLPNDKGQVYLIGSTESNDFPTKNPVQEDFGGGERDAFVAKLTEDGQSPVYSTYLGGPGDDRGQGLDVGREEQLYATVTTTNSEALMGGIEDGEDDSDTDAKCKCCRWRARKR